MNIATMPATAKISHIRSTLHKLRNSVKRADASALSTAIDYLADIERELRE